MEQFYDIVNSKTLQQKSSNVEELEELLSQMSDNSEEETKKNAPKYKKKPRKTSEVGIDIGIPGVRFCGLPHKNGPKFKVGNPLGKDFIR